MEIEDIHFILGPSIQLVYGDEEYRDNTNAPLWDFANPYRNIVEMHDLYEESKKKSEPES